MAKALGKKASVVVAAASAISAASSSMARDDHHAAGAPDASGAVSGGSDVGGKEASADISGGSDVGGKEASADISGGSEKAGQAMDASAGVSGNSDLMFNSKGQPLAMDRNSRRMRFMRAVRSRAFPAELTKVYDDPLGSPDLFEVWKKAKESFARVLLREVKVHEERFTFSNNYGYHNKASMLVLRNNDEDAVNDEINECIKLKKWRKCPEHPKDETRNEYWVRENTKGKYEEIVSTERRRELEMIVEQEDETAKKFAEAWLAKSAPTIQGMDARRQEMAWKMAGTPTVNHHDDDDDESSAKGKNKGKKDKGKGDKGKKDKGKDKSKNKGKKDKEKDKDKEKKDKERNKGKKDKEKKGKDKGSSDDLDGVDGAEAEKAGKPDADGAEAEKASKSELVVPLVMQNPVADAEKWCDKLVKYIAEVDGVMMQLTMRGDGSDVTTVLEQAPVKHATALTSYKIYIYCYNLLQVVQLMLLLQPPHL